jgi:hypothetical protein
VGVLVGIIYALLDVRSPALPVVALPQGEESLRLAVLPEAARGLSAGN